MSTTDSNEQPDTDLPQDRPTVASVATVASTSADVEAANPTHPDRPVGVNVDTAGLGTSAGDTDDAAAAQGLADDDGGLGEEGLGAETDAADSRDA
ncbi:MAG TPA: hypothetical protein VIL55_01735 [Naasia sp.]|jgi:hypothetical protein